MMVEIQLAHGKAPLTAGEKRILGVRPECYRAGGIRTRGLLHPRQALYQAEPQPELLPRSNQRAHLSRVLRAQRQDRISDYLRSHRAKFAGRVYANRPSPRGDGRAKPDKQATKQST